MKEVWRPIAGFEKYEVSNLGRVISYQGHEPRFLRLLNDHGYARVFLQSKRKVIQKRVHRLVLETFVGDGGGLLACHNDGNRRNNILSNLRWATQKENCADKIKHGTHRPSSHGNYKMCPVSAKAARKEFSKGTVTKRSLAIKYGVGDSAIGQLLRNLTWRDI